jgi:protein-S-isoprenylcysteine O-methyltransferase Ste14
VRSPSTRLPLIAAMARDLREHGSLRTSTASAMWAAYLAHGLLTLRALRRPGVALPAPALPAQGTGIALITAGLVSCLAGMERFAGPGELTGTTNQSLTTTGVYRYSRNPQYVGYLSVLAGAALARRSGTALAWSGVMAAAYAAWVPVEEDHLRIMFGQAYDDYRHRTNRWCGRST